jgi:hypothetical protein
MTTLRTLLMFPEQVRKQCENTQVKTPGLKNYMINSL